MTRPKPAVRLTAVLALTVSALVALGSTSSAQDPGPAEQAAERGDIHQPVTPRSGVSGHGPSGVESAPAATTNDGVEGESITGGGQESVLGADGRSRVNPTTTPIARRIGQLEINQGVIFGTFLCTGFLIDDNSILTAGHCVHDPGSPGDLNSGSWFPGRNGGTNFGECPIDTFYAPQQWIDDSAPQFDYGVINFANPGPCETIGRTLGTFGLMSVDRTGGLDRANATVQGYPGDKPDGTQWKMNGRIFDGSRRMIFYPMDTFGGQSGSPVFWNRTGGECIGACTYGVHAYGADSGLPGPDETNNAGPRITDWRIGQIMSWADDNDG